MDTYEFSHGKQSKTKVKPMGPLVQQYFYYFRAGL